MPFTIIDIGGLGGGPDGTVINTNATDINNNNVVVGESWSIALPCWDDPRLLCHLHKAIMWTEKDGLTNLGTLPGDTSSRGRAINNNNEIVGYSCHCGANQQVPKAVMWPALTTASNVPPKPIPLHPPNFAESSANDISDDRMIVGSAGTYPNYTGSKWINRQWFQFDSVSGSAVITGLNNSDISVGNTFNPHMRGNVWEAGSASSMTELPGCWNVFDLNESGTIVGRCYGCNPSVGNGPAFWKKVGGQWSITELEVPDTSDLPEGCSAGCNGIAKGINAQGTIVGQVKVTTGPGGWATIWENGTPQFLEDLIDSNNESWRLYSANAINDNGWIVGTGKPSGAEAMRGFVLIPTQYKHRQDDSYPLPGGTRSRARFNKSNSPRRHRVRDPR